jgi:hypothetical protein
MKQKLMQFLSSFEGKSVVWGYDDCSACQYLWLRANGHSPEFPEYSSQEEAHQLVKEAGGMVPLYDQLLIGTAIQERFSTPEVGDIAVIDTRLLGEVGVICGAGGICCWRKEGGFFWLAPRSFKKVWAVGE